MRNVTDSGSSASGKFQLVMAAFLAQSGLPFAEVLSAERVERIFVKHGNLFGVDAIYSTVVMGNKGDIRGHPFVDVRSSGDSCCWEEGH